MEKAEAEIYAQFLAENYKHQLREVFERNPIENLEHIENRIIGSDNPDLLLLVRELIKDLKVYDDKDNDSKKWMNFENRLWHEVDIFQQTIIQHFFSYSLLQAIFVSRVTPLSDSHRKALLKDSNITPKNLKDSLMKFWGDKSFLETIKHGGSKSELDDNKKLQFLAHYNRYQVVIKNARREKNFLHRKQKKSEIKSKREALLKYQIPEILIESAFSSDAPSEVALDWAMEILEINFTREYAKTLLNKIRQQNRKRGFIIDVDHSIGRAIYAFDPRDKQKAELICYPRRTRKDYETDELENFLVVWTL